jgi:DNA-binding LacI/PurR family transcriptional regulator
VVSIDDVAGAAGVSTATVSRALSGRGHVSAATRERVVATARSLGYVVSSSASSLASGRTRNVGVIVPFLDRWFFSTVLSGISSVLTRRGFDITLYNITADVDARQKVFESFRQRRRVDAIIAVAVELDERETERLTGLDIPIIAVGGRNPSLRTLAIDDVAVARLATEHLLTLGHRRVAYIGADAAYDLDFHVPSRRQEGFESAVREAGLSLEDAVQESADFTIQGGYHATKRLLGTPGPRATGIFAASDETAIGALLAARDLGVAVPQGVSVLGIDGHELSEFFGLTTVAQYPFEQGARAAEALLAGLEGTPGAEETPAPYRLIVRSTTAAPLR